MYKDAGQMTQQGEGKSEKLKKCVRTYASIVSKHDEKQTKIRNLYVKNVHQHLTLKVTLKINYYNGAIDTIQRILGPKEESFLGYGETSQKVRKSYKKLEEERRRNNSMPITSQGSSPESNAKRMQDELYEDQVTWDKHSIFSTKKLHVAMVPTK